MFRTRSLALLVAQSSLLALVVGCGHLMDDKVERSSAKATARARQTDDSEAARGEREDEAPIERKRARREEPKDDDSEASEAKVTSASVDAAPPKGSPDLRGLFAESGAMLPVPFDGIKKGMTPKQAGAVLKGAEKVDVVGISTVPAKKSEGVSFYRFVFVDGPKGPNSSLSSAAIRFSSAASTKEGFDYLVRLTTSQYGKPKSKDVKRETARWEAKATSVQIAKDQGFYELQVDF